MPKVTLTFNLPDEEEALKCANAGVDFAIAIHEIKYKVLRHRTKYAGYLPPYFFKKNGDIKKKYQLAYEYLHNEIEAIAGEIYDLCEGLPEVS